MNYLIDTNVISELVNHKPNLQVTHWFQCIPIQTIFLSVLTTGEIRKGIEKVKDLKRKKKLLMWLEQDLPTLFHSRILDISIEVADRWGRLQAEVKRTLPAIDSLIAATALHHDMTLVTRNTAGFMHCPGIQCFNPWE